MMILNTEADKFELDNGKHEIKNATPKLKWHQRANTLKVQNYKNKSLAHHHEVIGYYRSLFQIPINRKGRGVAGKKFRQGETALILTAPTP